MRILILTHSFNSLAQSLFVELRERGHDLSVEFDINDAVTGEAVELFEPDLILAPYLKRKIPQSVWCRTPCFIVHPGIVGDRGASSLDWAMMNEESRWGVTVIQANDELDGGDVWASVEFDLPRRRKSSVYCNEVTEATVSAVLCALERFASEAYQAQRQQDCANSIVARPIMTQAQRHIDWQHDGVDVVVRKINAADGYPGVKDTLRDIPVYLFAAHREDMLRGVAGDIIARREEAVCVATHDAAVWITQLKPFYHDRPSFKLPATQVLNEKLSDVPTVDIPIEAVTDYSTWRDIVYRREGDVGFLKFDFYNGAMSVRDCKRLQQAVAFAGAQDTKVIVLQGGDDFFSNGLHLNVIEAADSPAEESWRNIQAMNDLVQSILCIDNQWVISALCGNAGAGGAFLALAADTVYARNGVILNPHYKSMGNLYGSEYWTYLLPKRVGEEQAMRITQNRLPVGTKQAKAIGFIDDSFGDSVNDFHCQIAQRAQQLADHPELRSKLARKKQQRLADEARKPLQQYREEELKAMSLNFFGFDSSYHVARYNFVMKVPHSWTPRYLAKHYNVKNTATFADS